MTQPMIAWLVIAALMLIVLLSAALESYLSKHPRSSRPNPKVQPVHSHHHHHIIEIAREREMFYIPGDRRISLSDDDSDDFCDL